MTTRRAFLVAAMLTAACAPKGRTIPKWDRYREGEFAGFLISPAEHIVNQQPPISVRRVRGTVRSSVSDWPESTVVVVELRGPGSNRRVRTIAASGGSFDFGQLAAGDYVFKATVLGWQSATRTVTVSDTADPNVRLDVVLELGV